MSITPMTKKKSTHATINDPVYQLIDLALIPNTEVIRPSIAPRINK